MTRDASPEETAATAWARVDAALDRLLDLPPAERDGALARIALEDAGLAAELRPLLAGVAAEDSVLDRPASALLIGGAAPAPGLAPGTRLGPWAIVETIGHGGMGQVYRGRRADGQFEQEVAIKVARADSAAAWQRFPLERQIVARLDDPGIARLIDGGIADSGQPYMVMELVSGRPISHWCREHRAGLAQRLDLFEAVCEAVAYAHRHLVIHRDIKPSNVMVTGAARVKLLDFGIARLLDAVGAAATAELMLTPAYAAPEQLSNAALSTATDVYALGLLLHELLTGHCAQQVEQLPLAAAIHSVLHTVPRAPSSVARGSGDAPVAAAQLEGDLDAIVAKALRKEPAKRYPTVEALAADLARHRAHLPVQARRGTWTYSAGRALRRHRAAAIAAAVAMFALVTGTAAVAWQAQEARLQAARAEKAKGFVLSIFESADTDAGANRNTSALELLQQAPSRIDSEFEGDRATAAQLLTAVGTGLMALGDDAGAKKVLERAVHLAEQQFGRDDPRTCAALAVYGQWLVQNGKPDAAEAVLARAVAGLRPAPDAGPLIAALGSTVSLRYLQARYSEALAVAREAASLAETRLGPDRHAARSWAYQNLAEAIRSAGAEGRLDMLRRSLAEAEAGSRGRPTVPVLRARTMVAEAEGEAGQPAQSIPKVAGVLAELRGLLGPTHPLITETMSSLAIMQLAAGDPDAAAATQRELIGIDEAAGRGPGSPNYAEDWMSLGQYLLAAHHEAEAVGAFDNALVQVRQAHGPPNEVYVAAIRAGRAVALARQRSWPLVERDTQGLEPDLQPNGSVAFWLGSCLAEVRSLQGRHAEALALMTNARAALGSKASLGQQIDALVEQGQLLQQAGQPELALPELQQAIGLMRVRHPNGSKQLADALRASGRAHSALGQGARAQAEQAEAEALRARLAH